MREILFRGKHENNGAWVYGCYLTERACSELQHIIVDENGEYYRINPKTRGEYTGLTDKNGKKIFEDDIVRVKNQIGYVFFADDDASFVIETKEAYFSMAYSSECEVIGNIHDNKQMLSNADMPVSNDVFQPVFQPVLKSATPENFELMQG